MGLFYSKESKQQLFGYADAGYLSDPHKAISQTGYVFNCNGTVISWRSFQADNGGHFIKSLRDYSKFTKQVVNIYG